jgi:hypothetical protein
MTDSEISKLVLQELESKTLGVTSQYLEIHDPIYEKGILRIDRIDREKDGIIIAYLPVKDEIFSFAFYIDSNTAQVISVGTESRNLVSLVVVSETITSNDLKQLTTIECQEFWNKGDKKPHTKAIYSFSGIEFHLKTEPDEFEDKLNKLLSYIETDRSGILALTFKADAYIKVTMDFHRGNQLLGGLTLDKEILKRITALNLSMDFQITSWGNAFK